jgi:UDP-3-O-[3-hydroxymyristoyl] glucosamine N-acyltransferase
MPVLTLGEIARRLGGRLVGPDRPVRAVRPLEEAGPEDLSFLAHPRYRPLLSTCRAGGVLAPEGVEAPHLSLVVVARPYAGLAKVIPMLHPPAPAVPGIDPRSAIAADCRMGKDVVIGPFVSIGPSARIGDRTVLMASVTVGEGAAVGADCLLHPGARLLERCEIGDRVIVHAGAVVGSDGFGFAEEGGGHLKIPQLGNVIIEDDVEIGANATIDRATFGSTRIRRGTKIDNLVQIGHNCDVGENCILVAQVGLSGSVRLGRSVVFAGQSGSVGHIRIGDRSRIGAKSAVTGDLPADSFVIGHPARDHRDWKKGQAGVARLPELRRRLSAVERRLERLAGHGTKKED